MSALVASAIRNLREIRGSTSKEIMNYIKSQYTGTDTNVQKQVINSLLKIYYLLFYTKSMLLCILFYDTFLININSYSHHRINM